MSNRSDQHPMTEATPLASEQITQEDREAAADLMSDPVLSGWFSKLVVANVRGAQFDDHPFAEAFARHRIAALSASPAPAGWKLVPIEPTQAQHSAGNRAQDDADQTDARKIYAAMLAASPAPSGQGVSGEVRNVELYNATIAERNHWQDRAMLAESKLLHLRNAASSAQPIAWRFEYRPFVTSEWETHYSTRPQKGPDNYRRNIVPLYAAPAPSCAPGEVERLAKVLLSLEIAPISDPQAGIKNGKELIRAHSIGRSLAALSPQGLDAKEGELAFLRKFYTDWAQGVPDSQLRRDSEAWEDGTATPSQRLDAATVERCAQVVEDEKPRNDVSDWTEFARDKNAILTGVAARIRALATEPHQHGGKA